MSNYVGDQMEIFDVVIIACELSARIHNENSDQLAGIAHVSHVLMSNKGRHIVLDVSFVAVIALNLLRRAHDPQQR